MSGVPARRQHPRRRFPQPRHRRRRRAGVAERLPGRARHPPSRRCRPDPGDDVGDRRLRRPHTRGVAHRRAAGRAGARRHPDRRAPRGRWAAVRRPALQLRGIAALQDLGRHGHHGPAHGRGHAAHPGRQACRSRDRARRQLPARNSPRGMGPRDRVDAPHPRRRLEPRPEGRRGRFHPGRRQSGTGPFTDLARQLRQEAEEQARRHGRELGAAVAITPPKAA